MTDAERVKFYRAALKMISEGTDDPFARFVVHRALEIAFFEDNLEQALRELEAD